LEIIFYYFRGIRNGAERTVRLAALKLVRATNVKLAIVRNESRVLRPYEYPIDFALDTDDAWNYLACLKVFDLVAQGAIQSHAPAEHLAVIIESQTVTIGYLNINHDLIFEPHNPFHSLQLPLISAAFIASSQYAIRIRLSKGV